MTTKTSNLFALKMHLASALRQNVLPSICLNLGGTVEITDHVQQARALVVAYAPGCDAANAAYTRAIDKLKHLRAVTL